MHHSYFSKLTIICAFAASAFLAAGEDITSDTEYTSLPSTTLNVIDDATLTIAIDSDTKFSNKITADSGTTIQFKNTSPTSNITYSFSGQSVANNSIEQIWGSMVVGGANDSHATILNFKAATVAFSLEQDLTIYGNSELYTNAGLTTYSYVKGELSSLRTSASLTPQEAVSTPTLSVSISLRYLNALTLEHTINLASHNIQLVNDGTPITLTLSPDLFTAVDGDTSCTLFTNVNKVAVYKASDFVKGTEYSAADYFSSQYIDENTKLILTNEGNLILSGLIDIIPEPSTSVLALLGLFSIIGRKRRG